MQHRSPLFNFFLDVSHLHYRIWNSCPPKMVTFSLSFFPSPNSMLLHLFSLAVSVRSMFSIFTNTDWHLPLCYMPSRTLHAEHWLLFHDNIIFFPEVLHDRSCPTTHPLFTVSHPPYNDRLPNLHSTVFVYNEPGVSESCGNGLMIFRVFTIKMRGTDFIVLFDIDN